MRTTLFLLVISIFLSSCSSSTMIISEPPGATVYINSQKKGKTPYRHRDTKIVASTSDILLKKDGYKDFYVSITKDEALDVGALIGGIFFTIPFLWIMKYEPIHTYELEPAESK